MKKDEKFIWDTMYQKALPNIKMYLTNIIFLDPYKLEKSFLLYFSTILSTLGASLAQKHYNNKERVIYYVSKTLLNYEIRYTPIEKNVFCYLVLSIKNLKYYILGNTTNVGA